MEIIQLKKLLSQSKNMKSTSPFLIFLLTIILSSCSLEGMKNMMEQSSKIRNTIEKNCDCEEVSMMGYQIHNLTTTATYKLVGCEFESIENEASKIVEVLGDSITDFCDIDNFNLIFVNKGDKNIISYSNCELN